MAAEIEYDCSPWAGETRRILRSVLADSDIPHAWEGTVLVVPEAFEERVDTIVDDVGSTARSSLGTAREQVGYDVSPWSAASLNRLVEGLVEAKIPHEWDAEGDLVVHEEDAEALEELLGDLGDPDGGDELDGLELHDRLGRLFVAADRLASDPEDAVGRRDIEGAYGAIRSASLPYGVETESWLALHGAADELLDSLGLSGAEVGPDLDAEWDPTDPEAGEPPDPVRDSARRLRDLLRQFV